MSRSRPSRPLLSLAILVATLAYGCAAAPAESVGETNPCEFGAAVFDVGPVAFCQDAVALADARIGWLHWPVTSVGFRIDLCPPFARCAARLGPVEEGWVVFTFSIGEPSMIHVTTDPSGSLVAANPEAVPDWLRDELNQKNERPAQPVGAGG